MARDACRGRYRLFFDVEIILRGKGPSGSPVAILWMYPATIIKSRVEPEGSPIVVKQFGKFIDIELTSRKQVIIQYRPYLQFGTTLDTPLMESEQWAHAFIDFVAFSRR